MLENDFEADEIESDDIETDEIESDDLDTETDEEIINAYKKGLSKDKIESKRRLEEYFDNKRLEAEINYYGL